MTKSIQPAVLVLAAWLSVAALCPAHEELVPTTGDFRDVQAWAQQLAQKHGPSNVLLVFDVDNTLLFMNRRLGSDEWFRWQDDLLQKLQEEEITAPHQDLEEEEDDQTTEEEPEVEAAEEEPEVEAAEEEPEVEAAEEEPEVEAAEEKEDGLPTEEEEESGLVATDLGKLLRIQTLLLALGAMSPTQRDLPEIVRDLQGQGFPVILLTARGPEMRDVTERALQNNEFDFGRSALVSSQGFAGPYMPYYPDNLPAVGLTQQEAAQFDLDGKGKPRPVSYSQGVFMTAGQHKGAMLRTLLAKSNCHPKAIVFVDDSEKNVKAVIEAFGGSELDLVALRYTRMDGRVNDFLRRKKHSGVKAGYNKVKDLEYSVFGVDLDP